METGKQIELNNKVEKLIHSIVIARLCVTITESENLTEEVIDNVPSKQCACDERTLENFKRT